jgi:hypothetical protein
MDGTGIGWEDSIESDDERRALVVRIGEQQRRIANARFGGELDRGQHQKQVLAAIGSLTINDVPLPLRLGPFSAPFTGLPVACRFSNGQPCPFADTEADVRGIAMKFLSPTGTESDLLMTNQGGRSHARNAREFMAFADVLTEKIAGGATSPLDALANELRDGALSLGELVRGGSLLVQSTALHRVHSLATESYFGSVVRLGDVAFKQSLHPHPQTSPEVLADESGADYLRDDLLARLRREPVKWRLCVQLFADSDSTPVGDASVVWASDLVDIGILEISGVPAADIESQIDRLAFNPAHGFEPLGITHARRDVYEASTRNRSARGLATLEETRRLLVA